MILDKVDPLIVFKIALTDPATQAFANAVGFPEVGFSANAFLNAVGGLPIPIYLDEKISGIVVDSVSNSVDIDTSVEGVNGATGVDVSQRIIDSTLSVSMTCNNKDSLVLSAILAFMETILRKAVSRSYTISFIHGSAVVLDGLLKTFSTNTSADNELVTINMVISKVNGKPSPVYTAVEKVQGVNPLVNQAPPG